ncbi:uncharacterized protein LOC122668225 [Telopea speciosissima]|uniref:uncharacterized protein LOC122668225 n=1 Tax=Telopea speciosissima TaxID=54955 RepID=UPI001CC62DB0|nr:uncharacterized protein LOC122668225 [Telopea speciosissima]
MGSLHEKSSLLDNNSAIQEMEEGEGEEGYEVEGFGNDGCACFRFFGIGRQRSNERVSLLQSQQGENRESLWRRKLKDLKEITELLCGPKWKNLIRKLSVYANGGNKRRNRRAAQFQYDPQSYALNFDHRDDDEDLDASRLGFSSRFAAPSKINTGSVGFGFPSRDS